MIISGWQSCNSNAWKSTVECLLSSRLLLDLRKQILQGYLFCVYEVLLQSDGFLQDFGNCYISISVFDITWYSKFNSTLNLIRTLFITFALGFAMIIFNKDAQRLVLRPIERMLRKVKEVSENPLVGRQASRIKVTAKALKFSILASCIKIKFQGEVENSFTASRCPGSRSV